MIFKIQLHDESYVYMRGDTSLFYGIAVVSSDLFSKYWDYSQKLDCNYETHNAEKWSAASTSFAQSCTFPVPLAVIGGVFKYSDAKTTIRLDDGITRTHWLIQHGAIELPVYCCPSALSSLQSLIFEDSE